uniref:Alpha-2-macroglobulin bait region domain-containing protein n=1 Tax=Haplochromis burtoni TaxID=8153 RepID=A0A3Q3CXW5_HAPBU
ESGAETKFCVSVLELTEPQLAKTYSQTNILCFQVPVVTNEEVMDFQVKVEGSGFQSEEVRKVLIRAYKPQTFIQTDKPIYLPGQQVRFRVVTLDSKLRPASTLDPSGNRIGQWLKTNSDNKILQLSYFLSSEAREGIYKITVTMGESKVYYTFTVEKYVLPKFDVTIKVPDEVSVGDQSFKAQICSKYTFKQPVPGRVTVGVCRPTLGHFHGSEWIRVAEHIDESNSHDDTNPVCHSETKQVQVQFHHRRNKVRIEGVFFFITNFCVLISQKQSIMISYVLGRVSFVDTPDIYEPGTNVQGKVKAVYHNGEPIPDRIVYLFEGDISLSSIQNVKTDEKGVAVFSLSTNELKGDASLAPTLDYAGYRTAFFEVGTHTLSMAKPSSPDDKTVSFLEVKTKDKPLPCETEEAISIWYTIVGEAPGSVDLMYLVRKYIVERRMSKALMLFNDSVEFERSGEVSLKLTVSPEMTPDIQIVAYAVLPSENVIAHSAEFSTEKCFTNMVSVHFVPPSAVPGDETNFQVTALPHSLCGVSAIDQSVLIKEPGKTLNAEKVTAFLTTTRSGGILDVEGSIPNAQPLLFSFEQLARVRKNEAVIFMVVSISFSAFFVDQCFWKGPYQVYKLDILERIPDAAASGAPALPPDISPIKTVRTFFPETWIWDLVDVRESGTEEMTLTVPDTITTWETEAFCLSSEGFGLAPREDLKVFQPFFLELTMPYSIIRGEFFELKATVFSYLTSCMMVIFFFPSGDILGRALKNLDSLLQLPSGCGEQNMALLAPNIFILEYLKDTQQLTSTIEEKATGYLITGYQNQLTYKHTDGSYSAFGTGEGSTWLTAFVVKCFARAEKFIHIDPRNIEESNTWLENQQRENGCFKMSGRLIHIGMKGGVSDEVTLTAYITATFLENKKYAKNSVVKKSLACLKDSMNDLSNTYTTALLAYVFTLAGDVETRAHLLEYLDKVAVKQGEGASCRNPSIPQTSASLSVEISSYVLLAQISASPTSEELAYAFSIVRWLTEQQNYYGGFSSTQDTVVALQALAFYSTEVFGFKGSSKEVATPGGQVTFHVNRNNRLLYQEEIIVENIAGKYIVEMKGSTSVSVQVSAHINLVVPNKDEVTVHLVKITELNIVFSQLKGAQLVDRVEQREDHVVVYLREVRGHHSEKYQMMIFVLVNECIVSFPVQLVKDTPVEHSLELIEEFPVDNLKPAVVLLYDYYEPSKTRAQHTNTCCSLVELYNESHPQSFYRLFFSLR